MVETRRVWKKVNSGTSNRGLLTALLDAGSFGVFAVFELAVTFAELLLDLLGHLVDGRVEVAIVLLRVKVRTAHAEAKGAFELPLGRLRVVVLETDAGV